VIDVSDAGSERATHDGPEYCAVSGCAMKATDRFNQQPFCAGYLQERLAREY